MAPLVPPAAAAKRNEKPQPKKASRAGAKPKTLTKAVWHTICATYVEHEKEAAKPMTMAAFLRSDFSGEHVTGTRSQGITFSIMLNNYKSGKLKPTKQQRDRKSPFPDVERKLVAYIKLRGQNFVQDKIGLSHLMLKRKALEYAESHPDRKVYDNFAASPGFLSNVLKRAGLVNVKLHGEAGEMDEKHRIEEKAKFKAKLKAKIEEFDLKPFQVYNADQTGLYYTKLPNTMYVSIEEKKNTRGVKEMKSKDRITLMVTTAADGTKAPLFVVGKSKNPVCFERKAPPMSYTSQAKSWFDQRVTREWITRCFWPFHTRQHGQNTHALLILDNCSAQTGLDTDVSLPRKLHIMYFPPNMTSHLQPADMGIIASLKLGYKASMLEILLAIFDIEGGYERAAEQRANQRQGLKGITFGGKPHVLDAMQILAPIWNNDGKYAKKESVLRCWRKADILPASWNCDINNDVGSATLPENKKRVATELCNEICDLMSRLTTKTQKSQVDCNSDAIALQGSFAADGIVSEEHIKEMVENWIDVEDDADIINDDIEEYIEELERNGLDFEEDDIEVLDEEEHGFDDDDIEESETAKKAVVEVYPMPTFLEAEDCASQCIKFCKANNFRDAAKGFEQAARDLRNAQMAKKRNQSSLQSFFATK